MCRSPSRTCSASSTRPAHPHRLPTLPLPKDNLCADLRGIRRALAATRHLLEMYRRQLSDEETKRRLQRLDRRLLAVASQLDWDRASTEK